MEKIYSYDSLVVSTMADLIIPEKQQPIIHVHVHVVDYLLSLDLVEL